MIIQVFLVLTPMLFHIIFGDWTGHAGVNSYTAYTKQAVITIANSQI